MTLNDTLLKIQTDLTSLATDVAGIQADFTTLQSLLPTQTAPTPPTPPPGWTYYLVDPAGDDTADGKSAAWKTLEKVNSTIFPAGNVKVFLTGTSAFAGNLIIDTNVAACSQFVVDKFGDQPYAINAVGSVYRTGAVEISASNVSLLNGIVRGNNGAVQYGVLIKNKNGAAISDITVQFCDISGFWAGAGGGSDYGGEIFMDGLAGPIIGISILDNTLHGAAPDALDDNGTAGFGNAKNISGTKVLRNTVYNIGGRPNGAVGVLGNGILVDGHTAVEIANNKVYDCGGNTNTCGGPSGIQVSSSDQIDTHDNEVYNIQPLNFSGSGCDWTGIDPADQDTTNSRCYDNYVHDCFGPAITLYLYENWGPVSVHHNVVQECARMVGDETSGCILIGGPGDQGGVLYVFNNTVRQDVSDYSTPSVRPAAIAFQVVPSSGSIIANNAFIVNPNDTGRATFLAANNLDLTSVIFKANGYWNYDGDTTWYQINNATYFDLASWQADAPGGDTGALLADPLFAGGNGAPGYKLSAGSPFRSAGVDLTQSPYNLDVGTTDGFGQVIVHHNIGADCS